MLKCHGTRVRFPPPPPDCSDQTCSEPTGLADEPRRALLLSLGTPSTYDLGDILPGRCSRDAPYPIFPTSGPRIAPSLSVSLNLVDFGHLVHKIPVVAAQGLTTTAVAAVQFPHGVEEPSAQTGGGDSHSEVCVLPRECSTTAGGNRTTRAARPRAWGGSE